MAASAPPQKYVRSATAHAPKSVSRWLGSSLYASTPLARTLAKDKLAGWSPGRAWAKTPSLLSAKPAAKLSQKHAAEVQPAYRPKSHASTLGW